MIVSGVPRNSYLFTLSLFVSFFIAVSCQTRYKCGANPDNAAVIVPTNGYVIYESDSYPKTLNPGVGGNDPSGFVCNKTFMASDSNARLWIASTNVRIDEYSIYDSRSTPSPTRHQFVNTNNKIQTSSPLGDGTISINTTLLRYSQWNVFQAAIVAVSSELACPLESSTIDLSTTEFFVPIASQIFSILGTGNAFIQARDCSWTVKVPSGFSLKLVVRFASFYSGESLSIQSNLGVVRDISDTTVPVKYVLEGSSFVITHIRAYRPVSGYGFFAVLSAVKPHSSFLKDAQDQGHYDPASGYQANELKSWDYTVANNSMLRVFADKLDAEAGCDQLAVKSGSASGVLVAQSMIRVPYTGNAAQVVWNSDEDNQQAGFSFNTSVIPCYTNYSFILPVSCDGKTTFSGFPDGYCFGQSHSVSFQMDAACQGIYNFNFTLSYRLIKEANDTLTITSASFNYTAPLNTGLTTLITGSSSEAPLTIDFQAGTVNPPMAATADGFWTVAVYGYNPSMDLDITLSKDAPVYHYMLKDLRKLQKLVVTSQTGFEMYIVGDYTSKLSQYSLYEGGNFVATLDNNATFTSPIGSVLPRFYYSSKSQLVLQKDNTTDTVLDIVVMFKAFDDGSLKLPISCASFNKTHRSSVYQPMDDFVMMDRTSNLTEPCLMMFVAYKGAYPQLQLSFFTINSTTADPVILYAGDDGFVNDVEYLRLDSSSISQYKGVMNLAGTVFTFKIPAQSTLVLNFKSGPQLSSSENTIFSNENQTMLIPSPNFGSDNDKYSTTFQNNVSVPYNVLLADFQVTLLAKSLSANGILTIISENSRIDMTNVDVNSSFNITARWFQVYLQSGGSYLFSAKVTSWRINPNIETTTIPGPTTTTSGTAFDGFSMGVLLGVLITSLLSLF